MKISNNTTLLVILAMTFASILTMMWMHRGRTMASSFVGYSQSCWQIGDSLHVVTAKGDTVRLDVSKLK